jgi:hypothetical protein
MYRTQLPREARRFPHRSHLNSLSCRRQPPKKFRLAEPICRAFSPSQMNTRHCLKVRSHLTRAGDQVPLRNGQRLQALRLSWQRDTGMVLEPVAVHQGETQTKSGTVFSERRTQMLDRLSAILRRKGIPPSTHDAFHHHLMGVAADSGKEKAYTTAHRLLWVILFLAVVLPLRAQADGQIEPNAGNWRTWVISSGKDYRVPPPPGRSQTRAELRLRRADPPADHVLGRRRPGISLDRPHQRTSACRHTDDSQSAASVYVCGPCNV